MTFRNRLRRWTWAAAALGTCACTPTPRPFAPPAKTTWKPQGCRTVPTADPVLGSRDRWRVLHGDVTNTDEVAIALAPVFEPDWAVEPETFNVTGPVFDRAGNLYFSPLFPAEPVILISIEPEGGARRFAISGEGGGGGTPLVLDDPDLPGGELIYYGTKDRALALRTDGTILWDVPTGLTRSGTLSEDAGFGVSYVPQVDGIAGLTGDGHLYVVDRATGAALVDPPFSLPGERSVARGIVDDLPPGLVAAIEGRVLDELGPLLGGLPPGEGLADLIRVLLGDDTEVANFFAVDPASGRLWVAATAPDAEDGTVDGVSELGALYGLDLVASGSGFAITEVCHRSFPGGSASTPALRADGARIYVGDNDGRLIAINPDCSDAWTLDVGAQIIGSVGVASDNGELYVATARDVVQVIDLGAGAVEGWRAGLWAMYESGPILANTNVNLYSIAANGVGFQGGVGLQVAGFTLPVSTGVGLLDRETGAVRYFTPGFEETVAAMSTGPDGAMYIGHSPVRRAIARALAPEVVPPLVGGVGKYAPRRQDLLVRDAACAGADRAANAASVVAICPDSAHADVDQINGLIAQARAAGPRAVAAGELSSAQWADLDAALVDAEGAADSGNLESLRDRLAKACDFFS